MNEEADAWCWGGWMDGWTNGWKDGWMDGWMNMNGWVDGWMGGYEWMGRQMMDGWIAKRGGPTGTHGNLTTPTIWMLRHPACPKFSCIQRLVTCSCFIHSVAPASISSEMPVTFLTSAAANCLLTTLSGSISHPLKYFLFPVALIPSFLWSRTFKAILPKP